MCGVLKVLLTTSIEIQHFNLAMKWNLHDAMAKPIDANPTFCF
jgi:hypothetical protein